MCKRVFLVIYAGSVTVGILVYHTVCAYRNIHTAAADIVNTVSAVAHTDKSIHKMHLAFVQKGHHTDRIYRRGAELVHLFILLYRFFDKILLVVAKTLVKRLIIGVGSYCFLGYALAAELIYRLCEYSFTTLAEFTQIVRRCFFKIQKISADVFPERLIEFGFVIEYMKIRPVIATL